MFDLIVIGGGAAGFFGAIRCARLHPDWNILILEKGSRVLEKVKISGGGRCNVTHACFDPRELVQYYPRGHKELLGPFRNFMCGDMMEWLAEQGVATKIEDDGRVFPISDNSQTIINCFVQLAERLNIRVNTSEGVAGIVKHGGTWKVTSNSNTHIGKRLLIASGSNQKIWNIIEELGHQIAPPVPSLFTFKVSDDRIKDLPGISVKEGRVSIEGSNFEESGPILITHHGFSGPVILKLSAWAARHLHQCNYQFAIRVNWAGKPYESVLNELKPLRHLEAKRKILNTPCFDIPKRLWHSLVSDLPKPDMNWADISKDGMKHLAQYITQCQFKVNGKNTFKEEFVTCGGVLLEEVNLKSMASKVVPDLYFAGEVLNIDAVTGGFNFQAAWTTSWIAANNM